MIQSLLIFSGARHLISTEYCAAKATGNHEDWTTGQMC
jgi:hypothetical protein